jgi:hypothetical protein
MDLIIIDLERENFNYPELIESSLFLTFIHSNNSMPLRR